MTDLYHDLAVERDGNTCDRQVSDRSCQNFPCAAENFTSDSGRPLPLRGLSQHRAWYRDCSGGKGATRLRPHQTEEKQ
jgi:hypothetical protein